MGNTLRNVVVIAGVFGAFAGGTASASQNPYKPSVMPCRVQHVGAVQFCTAVEQRKAIRTLQSLELREAHRANVPIKLKHHLGWKVGPLVRANRWHRHNLAHLRSLPSSYCLGETGNRLIGCEIVQKLGWPRYQWVELRWQWGYESGWQTSDPNGLGCDGIPQACPAGKMPAGWQGNARIQILWGIRYIFGTYGSMDEAYHVEKTQGWY